MSTTTGDEPEVRAEDQEQINEFGRMNNRLLELRAEMKQLKADSEKLDDANTELMMASGEGKTMLLMGEAFVEVSEDYATEFCERRATELNERIEGFSAEEAELVKSQEDLKKILYARFGRSINLEP